MPDGDGNGDDGDGEGASAGKRDGLGSARVPRTGDRKSARAQGCPRGRAAQQDIYWVVYVLGVMFYGKAARRERETTGKMRG